MMMSWNLHPLFLREGDLLACASQSLQEHLQMCIIGSVACLLPIGFLALCTWVVLVEADCSSQLRLVLGCWSKLDPIFVRSWTMKEITIQDPKLT